MQTLLKKSILLLAGMLAVLARAEEGVVTEGKINVRGQPSLIGEVVTQLQKGDKVTILERVKDENPKPGEPAEWTKIKLPENTPVWVFSPFVKDGAVSASRLNLRAGPGENYSVVGRLERGAPVKSIRTIEEWMEIEAPDDAYAFVDSTLVKSSENSTAVAAVAPVAAAIATPTNSVSEPSPAALEPVTNTPPAAPVVAAPVAAAPVVTPSQTLPPVAQPAPPKVESAPGKRVVRREGIVRPTKSIQAPTWYELIHPETKITINYLHEEKIGVNLKGYKGQKVIVTGEEAIDPRWPNTPIMELESLDIAP